MPKRYDARSFQATAYRRLYGTARWQAIRADQLTRQPWCARCAAAGFETRATVCNHIDPRTKLNPDTFFAGPFESVCQPCHDQTIRSDEMTGKQTTAVGYRGDVDSNGWPTDERHPANR